MAPGTFTEINNDLAQLILANDLQVDLLQTIVDNTNASNIIADDSNAKLSSILTSINDLVSLLSFNFTPSAGPVVPLIDLTIDTVNGLIPFSGVPYLSVLPTWDDDSKCKVKVLGSVEVEGTVSVEPGIVPLDVIVLP